MFEYIVRGDGGRPLAGFQSRREAREYTVEATGWCDATCHGSDGTVYAPYLTRKDRAQPHSLGGWA